MPATHDNAGIAAVMFKLRAPVASYEDAQRFLTEKGTDTAVLGPNMLVRMVNGQSADQFIAVVLYDTEIIRYYPDGTFSVSNGGFATPTTRERLMAVVPEGFMVYHHAHQLGLYSHRFDVPWATRRKTQPERVLWPLDHNVRISAATGDIVAREA